MLVVGLGNPGEKYGNTKHNFGFWVLDKIIEKRSLKWKSGYGDYIYAKSDDIIFSKPTTFMNNSGLAIKDLCRYHNESEFLVVYDDIDLFLGQMRFRESGGSGGHKGIESIIYQLEIERFDRLKIGIGLNDVSMRPSERYVLKPFPDNCNNKIEEMLIKAVDAIEFYFNNSINETMNKYNGMIEGDNNNDNK
tara:strand:- start:188 stop:763 length:576 start_codon:yes stop_codon:yes gene_type:complete